MSKLSMAKRAIRVNSVLEYLERYERQAELTNRRNEKNHFQACWTTVFAAFYDDFRLPRYIKPVDQNAIQQPEEPKQKPQWFIDKYSRPMRKVVKSCKGFDVLSCGHKIASFDSTAKHRRCKECKGIPPPEKNSVRAYEVCKRVDKTLGKVARMVQSKRPKKAERAG